MINHAKVLTEYRAPLDETLSLVFDEFEAQLPALSPHGSWIMQSLREYSKRPSKRIRGSLAASMYDHATGQQFGPSGLRLGAAIEIIQNHLLIIDDVMDRSELRRGLPAVHKEYGRDYQTSDEHEAGMVGVLAGLVAGHCANLVLLSCDDKPQLVTEALRTLHRHITITDIGQMDDLQQRVQNLPIKTADVLRRYQQKSSYYSFVDPLEAALVLAGKDPELSKQAAEAYGLPAGVAFQLRDDYLGIFGESTETGKVNVDDLREGKYTFLIHEALKKLDESDKKSLLEILGSETASEAELLEVRSLLEKSGAVRRTQQMAESQALEATKAAHSATVWDSGVASMLEHVVIFAVERTK